MCPESRVKRGRGSREEKAPSVHEDLLSALWLVMRLYRPVADLGERARGGQLGRLFFLMYN